MKARGSDIRLKLEVEVDKTGFKLVQKANSWLSNFAEILKYFIYTPGGSPVALTNMAGTVIAWPPSVKLYASDFLAMNAPAGVDTYGILVGSGTTTPSHFDSRLASKISHGTGAGQLQYGATTFESTSATTAGTTIKFYRSFTNGGTGSVTIAETGVAARVAIGTDTAGNPVYDYVLVVRDVLSAPATVPAGATATVRYVVEVAV